MHLPNRPPESSLYDALRPYLALDARRLTVLVALILAVLTQRTCVLRRLVSHVALPGSRSSRTQRLKRFVQFTFPQDLLARFVLSLLPAGRLELILDRTCWHFGKTPLNILMLSASWQHFSLPLMWTVLDHTGNSHTLERVALLERFLAVHHGFAQTHPLSGLLGDREFIGKVWFKFLRRHRIPICIRLKATDHAGGRPVWKRFVHLQPGQAWTYGVRVNVLGVALQVVASTTPTGERLFLATEHPNARRALEQYARRWGCECLHQALKSRGFDLEETHLTHPERLSTLLAVLALAMVWCCLTGNAHTSEQPMGVLKHGRKAQSLFRSGLDQLQEALRPGNAAHLTRWLALLCPIPLRPAALLPQSVPF